MANTYTQIHIQAVFVVKYRAAMIVPEWKEELYKYITGIVQRNNHQLLAINGTPDHLHIFFGMRPSQSLSDLMQDIKGCSSKWINETKRLKRKFVWQEGYGAFSYHKELVPTVINYINNQEQHHSRKTFMKEYNEFLQEFDVNYDTRYTFKELE